MTANRGVRRVLGGLSALAVVAGASLVVVVPPSGAALSDPGTYGLVLLGAAAGLLVSLAVLAAADASPAGEERPAPPGVRGDPGPERAADGNGNGDDDGPVPPPTAGPGAEVAAEQGTDSIDSVQELFEQVSDEEPAGSLLDEDAIEGGFRFGGDREQE